MTEETLVKELESIFKFTEDTAKDVIQLAKQNGEYQDLCECVQIKRAFKGVTDYV